MKNCENEKCETPNCVKEQQTEDVQDSNSD